MGSGKEEGTAQGEDGDGGSKLWTEDEVGLQFPSSAFDFKKPNQGLADDNDVLATLPCRIIQDWKLHRFDTEEESVLESSLSSSSAPTTKNGIKQEGNENSKSSSSSSSTSSKSPPSAPTTSFRGCVSLPVDTECNMQGYLLIGTLKPMHEQQKPIRIKVSKMEYYIMDKSRGYRGYWIVTPTARYWLHKPSSTKSEIQRLKIRVEGEEVIAEDASDDGRKKMERIELASQQQLHVFHRAQLGLFSNLLDTFLPNNGDTSYVDMLTQSAPKELYTMLSPTEEKIDFYNQRMKSKNKTQELQQQQHQDLHSHPFDLELLTSSFQFLQRQIERIDPNMKKSKFFKAAAAASKPSRSPSTSPTNRASSTNPANKTATSPTKTMATTFPIIIETFTEKQLIESAEAAEHRSKQYPWGESLTTNTTKDVEQQLDGTTKELEHQKKLPNVNLALPLEVELMFQSQNNANGNIDNDDDVDDHYHDHDMHDDAMMKDSSPLPTSKSTNTKTLQNGDLKVIATAGEDKAAKAETKSGEDEDSMEIEKQDHPASSSTLKKRPATDSLEDGNIMNDDDDENNRKQEDEASPFTTAKKAESSAAAAAAAAAAADALKNRWQPPSQARKSPAATAAPSDGDSKKLKARWQPPGQTQTSSPPKDESNKSSMLKDRWKPPAQTPPPKDESTKALKARWQPPTTRPDDEKKAATAAPPSENSNSSTNMKGDDRSGGEYYRRSSTSRLEDIPKQDIIRNDETRQNIINRRLELKRLRDEPADPDMGHQSYGGYPDQEPDNYDMQSPAKKFKILSTRAGPGSKNVCSFFSTPRGCRNGANCKFLHISSSQQDRIEETETSLSRYDERRSSQRYEEDSRRPARDEYRPEYRSNDRIEERSEYRSNSRIYDERPEYRSNDRIRDERGRLGDGDPSSYEDKKNDREFLDLQQFSNNQCWGCGSTDHVYFDKAKKRVVCPRADEPEVKANAEAVHQAFIRRQREEDARRPGREDTRRVCSYFLSARGCRNGANCKFLHIDPSSNAASSTRRSEHDELAIRYGGDYDRNEPKGYQDSYGNTKESSERYSGNVQRDDYDARRREDSRRVDRHGQPYHEQADLNDPRRQRDYDSRQVPISRSPPGRDSGYGGERPYSPSQRHEGRDRAIHSRELVSGDESWRHHRRSRSRSRSPPGRDVSLRDSRRYEIDRQEQPSRIRDQDGYADRGSGLSDGRAYSGGDIRTSRSPPPRARAYDDSGLLERERYPEERINRDRGAHDDRYAEESYRNHSRMVERETAVSRNSLRGEADRQRSGLADEPLYSRAQQTVNGENAYYNKAKKSIDLDEARVRTQAEMAHQEFETGTKERYDNFSGDRYANDHSDSTKQRYHEGTDRGRREQDGESWGDDVSRQKDSTKALKDDIMQPETTKLSQPRNNAPNEEDGEVGEDGEVSEKSRIARGKKDAAAKNEMPEIQSKDPSLVENELAEGKSSYRDDGDRAAARQSFKEERDRRADGRAVHDASFQDDRGRLEGESYQDDRYRHPTDRAGLDRESSFGDERRRLDRESLRDDRDRQPIESTYRDGVAMREDRSRLDRESFRDDRDRLPIESSYRVDGAVLARESFRDDQGRLEREPFRDDRDRRPGESSYPVDREVPERESSLRDNRSGLERDYYRDERDRQPQEERRRLSVQDTTNNREYADLERYKNTCWGCGAADHVYYDRVNKVVVCPRADDPEVRAKAESIHQLFVQRAKDRSSKERTRLGGDASMQDTKYNQRDYSYLDSYKNRCWGCDSADHVYYDRVKKVVVCPRADDPEVRAKAESIHQLFIQRAKDRSDILSGSNRSANESTKPRYSDTDGAHLQQVDELRRGDVYQDRNASRKYEEDTRRPTRDFDDNRHGHRDRYANDTPIATRQYHSEDHVDSDRNRWKQGEEYSRDERSRQQYYEEEAGRPVRDEYRSDYRTNDNIFDGDGRNRHGADPAVSDQRYQRSAEYGHQEVDRRSNDIRNDDGPQIASQTTGHWQQEGEPRSQDNPRLQDPNPQYEENTRRPTRDESRSEYRPSDGGTYNERSRPVGDSSIEEVRSKSEFPDLSQFNNKCWGCGATHHSYYDKDKKVVTCPSANVPEVRAKAEAIHQLFIKRSKQRYGDRDERSRPGGDPSSRREDSDLQQFNNNQCWGCGAMDHVYYDKEQKMVVCPRANEPEVRARAAQVHQEFKIRRNSTRQYSSEGGNEMRRDDETQPSNPRFRNEY